MALRRAKSLPNLGFNYLKFAIGRSSRSENDLHSLFWPWLRPLRPLDEDEFSTDTSNDQEAKDGWWSDMDMEISESHQD